MPDQYSRTAMLIGREKLDTLKDKRVAIFGIGGVGGYVVESLARFGIGNFELVDDDIFCLSNINRQILATMSTCGKNKVDVAENRIHDINPEINVIKHKTFYLPNNKDEFDFNKYDYVVDALDTITAKIDIIMEAKEHNVPVISAMGCGNRLDPTKLVIGDLFETKGDPLSKVMRHELKKRGISSLKVVYSLEPPTRPLESELEKEADPSKKPSRKDVPGSSSFVPPVAGTLIGYAVAMDLLKEQAKNQ